MDDREKVIKGLEMCLASIDEAECPEECPYYETCRNYENRVIFQPVMRDTLELLKEQETREQCIKTKCVICPHCEHCDVDENGLLKEQEAVEPILKREGRNKYYNYYVCPCCDEEVGYDQNYCPECGAKFMWEGR